MESGRGLCGARGGLSDSRWTWYGMGWDGMGSTIDTTLGWEARSTGANCVIQHDDWAVMGDVTRMVRQRDKLPRTVSLLAASSNHWAVVRLRPQTYPDR
ncbi:hypothetical protein BC938DRAFT_481386 [Jimgerdemannia flammicorona]|uniref:Uncharacterized protein n=1 Tax=Jimgerdemannia flammicorona TaxID=994334 RepID=A0A433QGA9_9FUNG|nr:hypothetical protein BC938DRAFT_481386 [Jimgerdemannia flammicorona]